jgi:hypothetical protein
MRGTIMAGPWSFGLWILFYCLPVVLFIEEGSQVQAYVTQQNNFIVLKTRDSGTFVGTEEKTRSERTYYAFKGVPYAKPPLGPLRWTVSGKMLSPKHTKRKHTHCTERPISSIWLKI